MAAEHNSMCLRRFEKLVERLPGELNEDQMAEAVREVEDLLPKGRYLGPSGPYYNCGVRRGEQNRVDALYLSFTTLSGGGEIKMPVMNCISFYHFFAPELD